MTEPSRTLDPQVRETFASRFGTIAAMIGVAVGLGNVWRFPYMVGKFGGAAFLLFYLFVVIAIGVPALMAEWALGRHTRRGPVGAFQRGGLPFGRVAGWFFFCVVTVAMGYYSAVIGWVMYHALGAAASAFGGGIDSAAIIPPGSGFNSKSFLLQLACTGIVIGACALVLLRGVRGGIETASRIIIPVIFGVLLLLVIRSLTLPNAIDGLSNYVLRFEWSQLTPTVMLAAMGQLFFSLSLGGTYMVAYGSYLGSRDALRRSAVFTTAGDTLAGLIAGLVIFPAVFSLGLEPSAGPELLFGTLPAVFGAMPAGWFFGLLFFSALLGAAFLSDVAALEVLAAGLTDNTRLTRARSIGTMALAVWVLSIPPSVNLGIFGTWDLIFGSGMQVLGSLLAVITLGWCMRRSEMLAELSSNGEEPVPRWLAAWIRFGIPSVIVVVGVWWFLADVLRILGEV